VAHLMTIPGADRVSDSQNNDRSRPQSDGDSSGLANSAGPHAAPELTDPQKTPGSGMLPEPGGQNASPTG
jgi:hypothetical protein